MPIKVNVCNLKYEDIGSEPSCYVDVQLILKGGEPTERMDKLSTLIQKISEIEL